MNDEYYRFNNINDNDLSIILKAFNISIPSKLYKRAKLRNNKSKYKIKIVGTNVGTKNKSLSISIPNCFSYVQSIFHICKMAY